MKARIKRLLILILVCALLVNSDMAYLAMGVNMLYVRATETVELSEDVPDETEEETETEIPDETEEEADETTEDKKEPLSIEQMLSLLEVAAPEASLEDELLYLGADLTGVTLDSLSMSQVLALVYVDTAGMDLSAVTVEGIRTGEYSLYDILAMVQLRQSESVQTLESTSIIPATAEGLAGLGTTFTLSTYQDLIQLQKLSQTTSLEGYTFTFLKILDETNQAQWNFSKANVDGNGYIGIGSQAYPFKGTLNTYVSGMVCTINKPVCNYVAIGATFEGFNFNVNGASASIGQYLVTTEGNNAQNVTFKNVTVGGKIGSSTTAVAGGLFAYVENKTNTPIVLELGENGDEKNYSVKMTATVDGGYAGGVIGTVNSEDDSLGTVQIVNKMSVIAGTVTGRGNAAGGIVGKIGKNTTFTMNTSSFQSTVNGNGNNGGVVGFAENATFTNSVAVTVKSTVSSGNAMTAGGIIGKAQDAVSVTIENVTLNGANISTEAKNNMNSKSGGIIGWWNDTSVTGRVSQEAASFKNISIVSSSINGYDKAGIIGNLVGNNILADTVLVDNATKIGDSNNGIAGGVFGRVIGRNIDIKNSNITTYQMCGAVRGGVIGGMEGDAVGANSATYATQVRVTNATVATNFSVGNVSASTGGICGRAYRGTLMELTGDIKVQMPNIGNGTYRGYIVGELDTALVYFADSTVREKFESNKLSIAGIYDNVGSYGGVIENGNGLIAYDAIAGQNVTGTVAGSGVESDPYKITSKEDMMRLAIVLNTDGAFGAACFGVSADRTGAKQLRSAHFEVTNNIDLTNTGIYDLSRNDKVAEGNVTEYAFQGTFAGSNENIAITLDSHDTNQSNIGLFPSVKNATFKNLIIKTTTNSDGTAKPWRYAKHAAGIAPFVYGGITLDAVTSQVHLGARQETSEYYYGAIAGKIILNKTHGATVTTNNITLDATIEHIRVNQYVGGLAANVNAVDATAGNTFNFNGKTTISNKFIFTGDYSVGGVWKTSYAGGLIGVIYTGNAQNKTFVHLTAEDVLVDNQILDYSQVKNIQNSASVGNNDVGAGALIGHYWDNVESDFTKITVIGDETKIIAPPTTKARFGGLFGKMSGKMYLHDVDLLAGEFANGVNGSSLLVSHGKWLVLLVDEYEIDATKVKVTNIPTGFDEIMGMNIGSHAFWGGIVSIKSDGFRDFSESGYVNQVIPVTQKNDFTRYYYNLFEQSPGEYSLGMIENNVIDSPAKLMVWHLHQYCSSEIRRFTSAYIGTGSDYGTNYAPRRMKGTIDLKGYSYYPTPYYYGVMTGEENAKIIFYGDRLYELEGTVVTDRGEVNKAYPNDATRQQFRMHTGLLYAPNGTTIKNVTFTGSITNVGENSGAIAVNGCNSLTLENLTVDNLHITNYNNAHRMGLLISVVNDNSTVTLNGIKVTGYDDNVWGQGAGQNKYAASALIGRVGYNILNNVNMQSKNIKIYFSDMEVPYVKVKEDVQEAPVTTESPFKFATLIDTYEYTSDTDLYKGQGLYRFTQAEYDGRTVTLGKEISYGLMYDDKILSLPTAVLEESSANYLPYVCDSCSQTTIQVNPKRGDFLEGCGTYEDPYVLKNAKQIFQLYQYLSPKSVGNDTYLTGWMVNQLGEHGTHVVTTYGDEKFPTRDELRTAYYVVTADIDLTVSTDVNDYVVSNDFDGIGSASYPFAGVIYGADSLNKYTITLPGHEKKKAKTNYGFLNNMKGAVVKDLHITTLASDDQTHKDEIYINQFAGGVAAKIVGGDNIIDNVTVSTSLTVNNTSGIMGGYVGVIEKGGLIVRNLETDDVTEFKPLIMSNNIAITNTTDKVSALAGKVKDGYLLYEGEVNGATNTTKKVLIGTDFGFGSDALELSKTFQMVNAGYLDAKNGSDKIEIIVDDTNKTSTIELSNDAQLEIIALALNADALSSYSEINATNYNGYDAAAICRKAAYDSMGTSGTADGSLAESYDDSVHNFPYLIYKYCQINGGNSTDNYSSLYANVNTTVVSKLNKLPGVTDYTTTYKLTNGTYDMTDYQYAFRGLGELYDTTPTVSTDTRYSVFHADFDGGNSIIIANMNVNYDTAILTTGLFNDLNNFVYCDDYTAANSQKNTISNLIVEGRFSNTDTTNVSRKVGAIAGSVYGNWVFKNITLQKLHVEGDDATGGLIGQINQDATTNTKKLSYTFDGCKILGTKDGSGNITDAVKINSLAGGAGGLVGVVSSKVEGQNWYGGLLECKNTQIDGLEIYSAGAAIGGLIGASFNIVNSQYELQDNTATNMTLVATTADGNNVGGLIGSYIPVPWNTTVKTEQHILNMTNNTVTDSTLNTLANYTTDHIHSIGGLVGLIGLKEQNDANSTFTFTENTVEDVTLGQWVDGSGNVKVAEHPVGGLIGSSYGEKLVITDCIVRNTVDPTDTNAAVFTTKGTDIGGLVGSMQSRYCVIDYTHTADLTLESEVTGGETPHIANLKLVATKGPESNWATARGTRVGGLLGSTSGNNKSLLISDVKVDGCYIETENAYGGENAYRCGAGGLIGVVSTINDTDTAKFEVQYHNILVCNSDIQGGESAGLVGVNRTADSRCYNIIAQNIAVRSNNILGNASGGIFGMDMATGVDRSNNYKNIQITNNKIAAVQGTYNYIWSGGFTARSNNSGVSGSYRSAKQYYNEVVISENYIVGYGTSYGYTRIGGMFGHLSDGQSGRDYFIYNPVLKDNYIGMWNNGEDLSIYTLDELKNITKDKVGLLKYDTNTRKLVIADSLPTTLREEEIQYYATNIGSIAGKMMNGFRVVILRPEISYDETAIRPVVDCGVEFTSANNGVLIDGNYSITDSSYPYSYRSLFNVIYFEPDTTVSAAGNTVMNAFASGYGETEYLFDSLEDIMAEYETVDNATVDTNKLLDAYRLNLYYTTQSGEKITISDIYDKAYYDGSNDATIISEKGVTADFVGLPVIVYDAQNGTAQQVVGSFVQALTNAGGTLNSNIGAFTSITAKRALVKDGVITLDTSGTKPSITASGINLKYNHYDTYDATKGTSITLLEITIAWKTELGETVRETMYLPVYVLERLDVRSFIRMEEGAVYAYDDMKNSTIGNGTNKHNVIMANDTTYTLAIEFLYGSGRNKFENETVNKILKLTEESVSGTKPKALAPGTRLTMIDVETGYVYYYEATRENQLLIEQGVKKGIPFTDFNRVLTNDTTGYVNRTMAQINDINSDALQASYGSLDTGNKVYTNVGVERYLLIVDGSNAETENVLYDITVVADESQNNNSKDIYPADIINVTSIPGLKVGFEGKGTRTTISGQMMRSQEVLINVAYGIKAQKLEGQGMYDEAPYWTMASSNEVIDSANNSKYLELAIYLQDKKGNRVTLPQNTNISMNGQILTASGSQSVFYFYKDTMDKESLEGITGDKEWEEQIRLSFETAILDNYNDEYSMVVELLRTDDPKYPMSGDKPDYYGDEISAHIQTDLAVAVLAEDLLSLGINTYMEETHDYEIPFTSMIDFGSVIEFDLEDGEDVVNAQLVKWCDETEYRITYRLYKKVETDQGKEYVPIGNDRISLWREDETAEDGYAMFTATTDASGQVIYNEIKTFTQSEVRTGTNGAKGLMADKLLLKVNTEGITKEELSNYRLEMSVIAYDSETTTDANGTVIPAAPTGDEAVLRDFFIFTIAKLKTDME